MNPKRAKFFSRLEMSVLSLVVAAPLLAQIGNVTLSGTITGPSGTPVPNAEISVRRVATGESGEVRGDPAGTYQFPNLSPGDYEISVTAEGFGTKVDKLSLTSEASQTFNINLAASAGPGAPSLADLGISPSQATGNSQYQALLDRRSHMLQIHQRLGLITTAPLLATIFSGPGAKGHHGLPGSASGRDLHAALGATTAALYLSTAYFAIRAPKIPDTATRGPIRVHKALAWIHGPGMILTPILGSIAFSQLSNGERIHGIAKYHSDVAYVTAAAYGAAIISVSVRF
jgi:hypothetical protein